MTPSMSASPALELVELQGLLRPGREVRPTRRRRPGATTGRRRAGGRPAPSGASTNGRSGLPVQLVDVLEALLDEGAVAEADDADGAGIAAGGTQLGRVLRQHQVALLLAPAQQPGQHVVELAVRAPERRVLRPAARPPGRGPRGSGRAPRRGSARVGCWHRPTRCADAVDLGAGRRHQLDQAGHHGELAGRRRWPRAGPRSSSARSRPSSPASTSDIGRAPRAHRRHRPARRRPARPAATPTRGSPSTTSRMGSRRVSRSPRLVRRRSTEAPSRSAGCQRPGLRREPLRGIAQAHGRRRARARSARPQGRHRRPRAAR